MAGERGAARVCVVVSAYDRSELLPGLVRGLQAQTLEDFEAILVDNGSHDDTADHLRRLTAGDPRFQVLRLEDNHGPGRARNLGWRTTRAPLVAFTDDDCLPPPGWLAALVDAASEADIVQGSTIRVPGAPRAGWFDRGQSIVSWTGRYETCNLLFPRALLEELGGFSEVFPIAMGEDTDLGLRAEAKGATATFARAAEMHHHVWPNGFVEYLQQRRRRAEEVALVRENPAARRNLMFGFAHGGTHLGIWALVPLTIGSVAVGHPWVPLACIGAWLLMQTYRTRSAPWPAYRRFGYSAIEFVGRLYETGCYAVASVRYRTLVL